MLFLSFGGSLLQFLHLGLQFLLILLLASQQLARFEEILTAPSATSCSTAQANCNSRSSSDSPRYVIWISSLEGFHFDHQLLLAVKQGLLLATGGFRRRQLL